MVQNFWTKLLYVKTLALTLCFLLHIDSIWANPARLFTLSDSSSLQIEFGDEESVYSSNTTYTLQLYFQPSITLPSSTKNKKKSASVEPKFGFYLVALNSAGDNIGKFIIDRRNLRFSNKKGVQAVTTKKLSTTPNFTVKWTAPEKHEAPITFKAMALVVQGKKEKQYQQTHTIALDILQVNDLYIKKLSATTYPQPIKELLNIQYALKVRHKIRIALLNEKGKLLKMLYEGHKSSGTHIQTFELNRKKYKKGLYVVDIRAGASNNVQKIYMD